MTEAQEVRETMDEEQIENARVGYQVATGLMSSGSREFWSQFQAIMTGNSIVLAAATVAIKDAQSAPVLSLGLPFVGLALCVSWWVLHARAIGYNKYWIHSARELEEQFLNNPVRTLSKGGLLAEGQRVELVIDGKRQPMQMPRVGRIVRARQVVLLVIAAFTIWHLAILAWGVMQWLN